MGYRSNSRTELRARGNFQQPQLQPKARDVLVSWARAREYLDRAGSYHARHPIPTCEIGSLQ